MLPMIFFVILPALFTLLTYALPSSRDLTSHSRRASEPSQLAIFPNRVCRPQTRDPAFLPIGLEECASTLASLEAQAQATPDPVAWGRGGRASAFWHGGTGSKCWITVEGNWEEECVIFGFSAVVYAAWSVLSACEQPGYGYGGYQDVVRDSRIKMNVWGQRFRSNAGTEDAGNGPTTLDSNAMLPPSPTLDQRAAAKVPQFKWDCWCHPAGTSRLVTIPDCVATLGQILNEAVRTPEKQRWGIGGLKGMTYHAPNSRCWIDVGSLDWDQESLEFSFQFVLTLARSILDLCSDGRHGGQRLVHGSRGVYVDVHGDYYNQVEGWKNESGKSDHVDSTPSTLDGHAALESRQWQPEYFCFPNSGPMPLTWDECIPAFALLAADAAAFPHRQRWGPGGSNYRSWRAPGRNCLVEAIVHPLLATRDIWITYGLVLHLAKTILGRCIGESGDNSGGGKVQVVEGYMAWVQVDKQVLHQNSSAPSVPSLYIS